MSLMSPRELLTLFTAGWLSGLGALAALDASQPLIARILAALQGLAALGWFAPRLRLSAMGATLAVLALELFAQAALGARPGPVIFHAAVCLYLATEESRFRRDETPPS